MYYIYHLPNFIWEDGSKGKIGCSVNPKRRVYQQYKNLDWEILESHKDIDIASKREIELQQEYGYKVDKSTYKESVFKNPNKQQIAGKISAEKQWKQNREKELEKCRKGGKIASEKYGKKTIMCDMDGNFIKEFKNRKEAAKYVNGHVAPLTAVVDNSNRSYKGYKWQNNLAN